MACMDVANSAGMFTHHHRGGTRTPAKVLDAFEEFSGSNTGSCKGYIFSLDQIIGTVDLIEINAICFKFLAFFIRAGPDLALDSATYALNGGRGHYALGCCPSAHLDIKRGITVHTS